jgi:ParB family transcriptional regulator, chromosome partitioning protein
MLMTKMENKEDTIPSILAAVRNEVQNADTAELNISLLDAAPAEWNFYEPLNIAKMDELVESIESVGLINPIAVWMQPDSRYMILAGHNRVEAYRNLYEKTKDGKYLSIRAYIIRDISDETAKQIIIDSNWVTRNLSPIEKARSIYEKYVAIQGTRVRAKYGSGARNNIFDDIAKQYTMGNRMVQRYYSINKLIMPLQEMLKDCKITLMAAEKLAAFDQNIQKHIYSKFSTQLDQRSVMKLKADMTKAEIDDILSGEAGQGTYTFKMVVPMSLKEQFEKYVQKFFEDSSTDAIDDEKNVAEDGAEGSDGVSDNSTEPETPDITDTPETGEQTN